MEFGVGLKKATVSIKLVYRNSGAEVYLLLLLLLSYLLLLLLFVMCTVGVQGKNVSEDCLFNLFMFSFAVQKLLSFIRSHLFIFVFISISLEGGSKKTLL